MDFEKRLERAIHRGTHARNARNQADSAASLSEKEMKALHSRFRIELSEHIENCLKQLAEHFPGFGFKTIVGDDGWGGKINRDDVNLDSNRSSTNLYSRFEMVVRPYSPAHIVELVGKATIRNKELFTRSNYQMLDQGDEDSFKELIDLWVLDFAEQYASQ